MIGETYLSLYGRNQFSIYGGNLFLKIKFKALKPPKGGGLYFKEFKGLYKVLYPIENIS